MSKRKPALTYTIDLPNGITLTRNSARVFTHAVVGYDNSPRWQDWRIIGICGSMALAEKRLARWHRYTRNTSPDLSRIVPVYQAQAIASDPAESPCRACDVIARVDDDKGPAMLTKEAVAKVSELTENPPRPSPEVMAWFKELR